MLLSHLYLKSREEESWNTYLLLAALSLTEWVLPWLSVPSEHPFRVPAVRPLVSPAGVSLSGFSASCSILSTCSPLICPVFICMYCLPSCWWVTSFSYILQVSKYWSKNLENLPSWPRGGGLSRSLLPSRCSLFKWNFWIWIRYDGFNWIRNKLAQCS